MLISVSFAVFFVYYCSTRSSSSTVHECPYQLRKVLYINVQR
uniref:Uncharacterized protein n=1 Tax=Setaria viridis TaxID=4556 RepID=A0A4U6WGX9_SETVI|nr:hypothetical protein SEVIR_1G354550v2 [Setaria viridis]